MEFDNRPLRKELLAALSQVPEVARQTKDLANAIRRDARALARRKTGNLARNIQVERVYDRETGSVSYIVGWGPKAWYGWIVEAGTQDTAPAPHLVPAAVKNGAVSALDGGA